MKWAAETAVSLNTSVPWVMCSQEDAPDPIVSVLCSTMKICCGSIFSYAQKNLTLHLNF